MSTPTHIAIIGGGPAGLMAAETLALAGHGSAVHVYDRMASVGRKFLLAGRGGLNLTHSEPWELFIGRYGRHQAQIRPWLEAFSPTALRHWADELGAETFIGSSGRVFPKVMKASPLLRAWLGRLAELGVTIHTRHQWQGWDEAGQLLFETPTGPLAIQPTATILALGGGSWPRMGSNGAWVPWLQARGAAVNPLLPANCGFEVGWSDYFAERFAGEPVKGVVVSFPPAGSERQGEFVISQYGVEGSLIYAVAAAVRDALLAGETAVLSLDLVPHLTAEQLAAKLVRPKGSRSLASHLASKIKVRGVKFALLRELLPPATLADPVALAQALKGLPLPLRAPRPLAEAISSAGGVAWTAVDEQLMLRAVPGVFCAGEMLDWEAPTGGYLLTACMASGRVVAHGVLAWLGGDD